MKNTVYLRSKSVMNQYASIPKQGNQKQYGESTPRTKIDSIL